MTTIGLTVSFVLAITGYLLGRWHASRHWERVLNIMNEHYFRQLQLLREPIFVTGNPEGCGDADCPSCGEPIDDDEDDETN